MSQLQNKMAKFETKVCMVNAYDEIVCELEHVNGDYYRLPKEVLWDYMFVGDRFEIKEIETEVE